MKRHMYQRIDQSIIKQDDVYLKGHQKVKLFTI